MFTTVEEISCLPNRDRVAKYHPSRPEISRSRPGTFARSGSFRKAGHKYASRAGDRLRMGVGDGFRVEVMKCVLGADNCVTMQV